MDHLKTARTLGKTLANLSKTCRLRGDGTPAVEAALNDFAKHYNANADGKNDATFTTTPDALTSEELGILAAYFHEAATTVRDSDEIAWRLLIETSFYVLDCKQQKQLEESET